MAFRLLRYSQPGNRARLPRLHPVSASVPCSSGGLAGAALQTPRDAMSNVLRMFVERAPHRWIPRRRARRCNRIPIAARLRDDNEHVEESPEQVLARLARYAESLKRPSPSPIDGAPPPPRPQVLHARPPAPSVRPSTSVRTLPPTCRRANWWHSSDPERRLRTSASCA